MISITRIQEMQQKAEEAKRQGKSIGFVPTMGFLHEGHQTLIRQARKENDMVVVSVFVNPLQFGPSEDFDRYPRDLQHDMTAGESAGADILFHPDAEEMYGGGMSIHVTAGERAEVLCGSRRPGHFDGVAVVLMKLFNITAPDRVYFGLKDAQQAAVVDALVRDFNFPIEVIPVKTVREVDGLAKSSRNVYLKPDERKQAPEIFRSLQAAEHAAQRGERDPKSITGLVRRCLESNMKAEIDYIEIYSYPELRPLEKLEGRVLLAAAVQFSNARLIDNIIMDI